MSEPQVVITSVSDAIETAGPESSKTVAEVISAITDNLLNQPFVNLNVSNVTVRKFKQPLQQKNKVIFV